jgi:type VI secretion system secreted protein VgrG
MSNNFINLKIDEDEIQKSDYYVSQLKYTGRLSSIYKIELQLICNNLSKEIFAETFLCKNIEISINYGEYYRNLCGIVQKFIPMHNCSNSNFMSDKNRRLFKLIVSPDFLQKNTAHNKIYTEKATSKVVEDMLKEHTSIKIEKKLSESYFDREFCLQHNLENDLKFFNRLLSEEGIYYYFNTSGKQPGLILSDSKVYDDSKVVFDLRDENVKYNELFSAQIESFKASDHDPANPGDDKILSLKNDQKNICPLKSTEFWPYPGPSDKKTADGEKCLNLKSISDNTSNSLYKLRTNNIKDVLNLDLAREFTVNWKDNKDKEIKLAVAELNFTITNSANFYCECSITAFGSSNRFVPKLQQAPYIPHLPAVIIGDDGIQRNLSDDGGVQIRFYWEKEGETTYEPYWARVAQLWGGNNYGTFFRPPIGTEVIAEFLYGPNRKPVIMGCLHDKAVKYPGDYGKFCSGIISKNEEGDLPTELVFDDTKDSEKFIINTANDYSSTIHNNRDVIIEEGDDNLTLKEGFLTVQAKKGIIFKAGEDDDCYIKITPEEGIIIKHKNSFIKNADKSVHVDSNGNVQLRSNQKTIKIKTVGKNVILQAPGIELK